uniref:Uncharacterized protein n=1 Tax=Cannabis sativa TaxID=3483 RepID=A0A803NS76_CANSA
MCHKAPLMDPHIVDLMARGMVHQVEDAKQLEASQVEEPLAGQEEEPEVDQAKPKAKSRATSRRLKECHENFKKYGFYSSDEGVTAQDNPPEDPDNALVVKEKSKEKRLVVEKKFSSLEIQN